MSNQLNRCSGLGSTSTLHSGEDGGGSRRRLSITSLGLRLSGMQGTDGTVNERSSMPGTSEGGGGRSGGGGRRCSGPAILRRGSRGGTPAVPPASLKRNLTAGDEKCIAIGASASPPVVTAAAAGVAKAGDSPPSDAANAAGTGTAGDSPPSDAAAAGVLASTSPADGQPESSGRRRRSSGLLAAGSRLLHLEPKS